MPAGASPLPLPASLDSTVKETQLEDIRDYLGPIARGWYNIHGYDCFSFSERLSMATVPTIVSKPKASGMYNVCVTAWLYPERTAPSLSLPMEPRIWDKPMASTAVPLVDGEYCCTSSIRRLRNSVEDADTKIAEPIPAPKAMTAVPIDMSSIGKEAITPSCGHCMPKPIATPRNPIKAEALPTLWSRLMVVSRPDAVGARTLLAYMKAKFLD